MAPTGGVRQPTARVAPWSRFEEAALDTSIRRRLFTETRAMVILSGITSHVFPPNHVHSVDQVITVVAGRVEIRIDGKLLSLDRAEAVLVSAGVPHSVRTLGPDPAETLNIFSPES